MKNRNPINPIPPELSEEYDDYVDDALDLAVLDGHHHRVVPLLVRQAGGARAFARRSPASGRRRSRSDSNTRAPSRSS